MYTQRVQEMEGKSRVEDFYRKDEPEMLFLLFFFGLLISLVLLSVMLSPSGEVVFTPAGICNAALSRCDCSLSAHHARRFCATYSAGVGRFF